MSRPEIDLDKFYESRLVKFISRLLKSQPGSDLHKSNLTKSISRLVHRPPAYDLVKSALSSPFQDYSIGDLHMTLTSFTKSALSS